MRIPRDPPAFLELVQQAVANQRLASVLDLVTEVDDSKYRHWDKIRHCPPPAGFTAEEHWLALKFKRQGLAKKAPIEDREGQPFEYVLADPIPEWLHEIDLSAGGRIQMPEQITNTDTRDQYYVSSLIEEAITSSQLEGATTTRQVAKEMIKQGRPPRDKSERMILNNFKTMRRIGQLRGESLTKELVFELHRLVTDGTLADPTGAGRFRRPDESVQVVGAYNEVFHDPPPAEQLQTRMEEMCEFGNGESPEEFVHPVIRAIVLHFWLSYDHPFVDGNGRTARALFYWSMLRSRYWLAEFISISHIIRKSPVQYGRAFLLTEHGDNDLTYFIMYHLKVFRRAVRELNEYIARKTSELRAVEAEVRGMVMLNHRQRALVGHALRHPHHHYEVASHQLSHNVSYETARSDLQDLENRGVLGRIKAGKRNVFFPAPNIQEVLNGISG